MVCKRERYFGNRKEVMHYHHLIYNVLHIKTNIKLSNREKELLEYAANGFSIKEIAELIKLSRFTIDTHNRNILRKLAAKNMKHAIALSIRNGFI